MPQTPVSQAPVQHMLGSLQDWPSSRHEFTGVPQTPPAHTALQHSSSTPHASPSGAHT
jgi:hypothetical protein